MSVLIVYGTVGGNTELVARKAEEVLGQNEVDVHVSRVETTDPGEVLNHEVVILASPTYYHGETEANFPPFLKELKKLDLNGKKFVAVGLGDKKYYPEYLCDAAKVFEDFIKEVGGEMFAPSLRIGTSPALVLDTMVKNWAERVAKKIKS